MTVSRYFPQPPSSPDEIMDWANEINNVLRNLIPEVLLNGALAKTNIPVNRIVNVSQDAINNLNNVQNGCIIYNISTGNLEYFHDGQWVVISNV